MRTSSKRIGYFYLFLGILFVYLAAQSYNGEDLTLSVILLIFIATFDIGTGLKMIWSTRSIKKQEE